MDAKNSLGKYIKQERTKRNFSQRELARRTNIDNAMISRIEKGEIKKPSYEILKKISRELDVNLIRLLTLAQYTHEELSDLGLITSANNMNYIDKIENYIIECNGNAHIDLIEVFNDFYEHRISLHEFLSLFMSETGIDLSQYIPQEILYEHSLEKIFDEIKNGE